MYDISLYLQIIYVSPEALLWFPKRLLFPFWLHSLVFGIEHVLWVTFALMVALTPMSLLTTCTYKHNNLWEYVCVD